MGADGIIVSLRKDFANFTQFMRELKTETVNMEVVDNFLASLKATEQYTCLTLQPIKEYIENIKGKRGNLPRRTNQNLFKGKTL